jgi:hypothetical protein
VEFQGVRYPGKALVYGRHEKFCERGCYRDAPVAVWLAFVAFSFVDWLYLRCSPRFWGELIYRAFVHELRYTFNSLFAHMFKDLQWHAAHSWAFVRFERMLYGLF